MNATPELIVMLTYNDVTVENAEEIFDACRNTKAKFWGFKEKGLSIESMKILFSKMKAAGKTTALEVVVYDEEGGLEGAKKALECGCDILMGTTYFDSINDFCKKNNLKYMPFAGEIVGRPSVLKGEIKDIIAEAQEYLKKGVYGIDLLGYRYVGDAVLLNKEFVREIDAPVCLAGSVDSFNRLDEVLDASPYSFTIGSAFFNNKFGDTFAEQIDEVVTYMEKSKVHA